MTVDAGQVAERAERLRGVVAQHATRPVTIVGVTKQFGPDAVRAAMAAGIDHIGENYAQELAAKVAAAAEDPGPAPRWHFIGHVQRNKVRLVAEAVHLWETVDSVRLGREIAKRAPGAGVLVQANLSGTGTQSGVAVDEVPALVDGLRELPLEVRGLMTIGAFGDLDESRRLFGQLRRLADDLELVECSMGMSADLVPALEEGATIIRVGTALFGPRPG